MSLYYLNKSSSIFKSFNLNPFITHFPLNSRNSDVYFIFQLKSHFQLLPVVFLFSLLRENYSKQRVLPSDIRHCACSYLQPKPSRSSSHFISPGRSLKSSYLLEIFLSIDSHNIFCIVHLTLDKVFLAQFLISVIMFPPYKRQDFKNREIPYT